jgi:hypothetical protein
MQARRILLTIAGVAGLAAALGASAGAQSTPQGLRASVMPKQSLSITINVAGTGHGEHVTVPTFAIEPGLPVHLTFTNRSQQVHTFTIPGLGVYAVIAAAHGTTPTKTTVTFTAHKHGAFGWECLLCPSHGGGADETMKGTVYAIMQV